MKHILSYKERLNELKVNSFDDDYEGKYFISYSGNVWLFTEDEYEQYVDEISNKLGIELDDYFELSIFEDIPYVLVGHIHNNTIILSSIDFRHSSLSEDLHKLSKKLNMTVEVETTKNYVDIYNIKQKLEKNIKTATFYHGTCMKFLPQIKRKGIIPTEHTNFKDVQHDDKIFVTTNIEKARFHAVNASAKNNSFPIILKFKIPDVDKLVIDFDLAVDILGVENEITKKLGYSDIAKSYNKQYKRYKLLDGDEKMDFAKKLGTYGYLGRIPSSYLTIMLDKPFLQRYWFDIEEGMFDSEMFTELNDEDTWSELSFKEYDKLISEIEDEYNDYYNDEEDNDD